MKTSAITAAVCAALAIGAATSSQAGWRIEQFTDETGRPFFGWCEEGRTCPQPTALQPARPPAAPAPAPLTMDESPPPQSRFAETPRQPVYIKLDGVKRQTPDQPAARRNTRSQPPRPTTPVAPPQVEPTANRERPKAEPVTTVTPQPLTAPSPIQPIAAQPAVPAPSPALPSVAASVTKPELPKAAVPETRIPPTVGSDQTPRVAAKPRPAPVNDSPEIREARRRAMEASAAPKQAPVPALPEGQRSGARTGQGNIRLLPNLSLAAPPASDEAPLSGNTVKIQLNGGR